MAVLGMGNGNLIQIIIQGVFHVMKKKQKFSTPMCDGFILKLHYFWTFSLFMFGFATVWYSWYFGATIICRSHFNADVQVSADNINICLSF